MSYFSQIEIGITQIIVSLQRNKEIMRYDVLFFPAPAKHNNLSSTVFRFVFFIIVCVGVGVNGGGLQVERRFV